MYIMIDYPEDPEERKSIINEIRTRIRDAEGPFADALFDVQQQLTRPIYPVKDGKVTVSTDLKRNTEVADKARYAAVTWPSPLQEIAEAIYLNIR